MARSSINPKISVIVSVWNNEDYIDVSMKSILGQTLQEIEVVCVYRQSDDRTTGILKEYAKNDSRIVLVEQKDTKGCGPAKNLGIRSAKGDFVAFLDADDYFASASCLELLYTAAIINRVKICGGLRTLLQLDGKVYEHGINRKILSGHPDGLLLSYRDFQNDYHFHNYIYERRMLLDNGCFFGTWLVYDDISFHIRAMSAAEKFYIIPVEMYCYRIHGAYVWNDVQTLESIKGFSDVLQFSDEHDLALLHWKTFQRMCFGEYHDNFVRHLQAGNTEVYRSLMVANCLVNAGKIRRIQESLDSYAVQLEGADLPSLDVVPALENGEYVFPSLWHAVENLNQEKLRLENRCGKLEKKYEAAMNSKTYRLGSAMLYVPKQIMRLLGRRR